MPAIDSRSVTSACARLGVGARERREHALIFGGSAGRERQALEIVREAARAVEILDQPPLPGRREIERGDQRGNSPTSPHADLWTARSRGSDAEMLALALEATAAFGIERG